MAQATELQGRLEHIDNCLDLSAVISHALNPVFFKVFWGTEFRSLQNTVETRFNTTIKIH